MVDFMNRRPMFGMEAPQLQHSPIQQSRFFPYIKIQPSNTKLDDDNNHNQLEISEWTPVPRNYEPPKHKYKFPPTNDLINFNIELPSISSSSSSRQLLSYKPIPEVQIAAFEVEMIGGPCLVHSSIAFDEKDLRIDCLVKLQLDVLNRADGETPTDPEANSLGEGNLRIYLTKNYVTLITFLCMETPKRSFLFLGPIFSDLITTSYKANSEKKSISWQGLSVPENSGDSSDVKKVQMNRYTATFPKTRIFIHATNVFTECRHSANRAGVSVEKFLQMTNRDESHIVN